MTPSVLLITTCRWFPTARLGMALAHAGCKVEAVCPSRHPIALTGAASRIHSYRDFTPLSSVSKAIASAKPDIIIPGDDLATRRLHDLYFRETARGTPSSPICNLIERSLGAPESFPIVFHRTNSMKAAAEAGAMVPLTEVVETSQDLRNWIARAGFPTVLKANNTSGGNGVRVVRSMDHAEEALRRLQSPPLIARAIKRSVFDHDHTLLAPSLLRRRPIVNAQAFIEGREATSAVVCKNGQVLAALHFEVVAKTANTGHATVLRVIENSGMSASAEKVAARLKLSGLHGFDFMLEAHTGNAYLIEINPRATQVGHLSLGPGRDLPAALYAAISGAPVRPTTTVTDNTLVALFPQEWIRDSSSPFLKTAYHDVPWEAPEFVTACARSRRKQSSWYAPRAETKPIADVPPVTQKVSAGR